MSFEAVQEHVTGRMLELPSRARGLHRELRNVLRRASDAGKLLTGPNEIYQLVRLLHEPPPQVAEQLEAQGLHEGAFCIVGGEKNQNRDHDIAHLARDDGAWFDFSITVRERRKQLELVAQDFEIRLPPGMSTPFLRFDYNLPAHRNEEREMRCHLHPGSDDILVPAPLMSPMEMLALFIDGLRWPEERKRRGRTPFEVEWFQQMHAKLQRGPT